MRERPEFFDSAACRGVDPAIFYPETADGTFSTRRAKEICGRCNVSKECLAYAVAEGEALGVWGGLSPSQRRRRGYVIKMNISKDRDACIQGRLWIPQNLTKPGKYQQCRICKNQLRMERSAAQRRNKRSVGGHGQVLNTIGGIDE